MEARRAWDAESEGFRAEQAKMAGDLEEAQRRLEAAEQRAELAEAHVQSTEADMSSELAVAAAAAYSIQEVMRRELAEMEVDGVSLSGLLARARVDLEQLAVECAVIRGEQMVAAGEADRWREAVGSFEEGHERLQRQLEVCDAYATPQGPQPQHVLRKP